MPPVRANATHTACLSLPGCLSRLPALIHSDIRKSSLILLLPQLRATLRATLPHHDQLYSFYETESTLVPSRFLVRSLLTVHPEMWNSNICNTHTTLGVQGAVLPITTWGCCRLLAEAREAAPGPEVAIAVSHFLFALSFSFFSLRKKYLPLTANPTIPRWLF